MLKSIVVVPLLCLLQLTACAVQERHHAAAVPEAPDEAAEDKKLDEQLAALETVIRAPTFKTLSGQTQFDDLSSAGRLAVARDQPKLGYRYLALAAAMPEATPEVCLTQVDLATTLGYSADSVAALAAVARRWPQVIATLNDHAIGSVVNASDHLPHAARVALLQSLYAAHWKLKWNREPSNVWGDLTWLLVEAGNLPQAIDVSLHVTDPYVLIAMRSDRRFDAIVAANPAHFDIDAAAARELRDLQDAAERTPSSLEVQARVIEALMQRRHYEGALAASDAVIQAIESTNYPRKLYEDYDDAHAEFLKDRADALAGVGNWDEATAELSKASAQGSVDQIINYSVLLCDLGRPRDALTAIGRVEGRVTPFGVMQVQRVRLEAARQLGDAQEIRRGMAYLRDHRNDDPSAYQDALIRADKLDEAAAELIAELRAADERLDALLGVQTFIDPPGTAQDKEMAARSRAVIARSDVQAAIAKVGRIGSYRLIQP